MWQVVIIGGITQRKDSRREYVLIRIISFKLKLNLLTQCKGIPTEPKVPIDPVEVDDDAQKVIAH